MRIMSCYYPETLHRVFFYRPNLTFRLIYVIFRLWAPERTRQ